MQRSFKESVHLLCKKAHSLVFILAFLFSIDSFGQAPAAPDKLGAVVVSSSSVILNWEDKSNNETGFQIERSLSFGIGYTLLTTTAANVKTYTDTGLTAGTTYYYRMRSINSNGNSFYTLEAIAPVARSSYRRFLLDFGDPVIQTTATGWNNITSIVAGSVIPLKDSNGNTTSLNLEVVTEPSANYAGGNDWISSGYNGQMADYPISAVNDSHLAWSGGGSYKLTGLDNSKVYDLRIFSSRNAPSMDREGLYTINGQQKTLNAANNSSRTVLFSNITPVDASITIHFNVAPGSAFAYINVMDIIESTNLSPTGAFSKLVLTPSMASAISPVGEGNPALLLDEQTLAGNPAGAAGGQPTTSWGTNLSPKVMTSQIDLGVEYVIKQVWLFDSNGEAPLPNGYKVMANTSAGEVTLVNSPMTGYLQWTSFDVDVTTRILTIINPTGYIGMNELVLYGYAIGANTVPTANAGPDQIIDLPNSVSIVGSGTDSDGTIASYLWTQVSGPNTATLEGNNTATVTPTSLVAGTYVFRLTVTDNLGATGSDDVVVTVNNSGQGPPAPDKLGAVVVSSSSVILNWEDKSNNETGFQIERSLSFGIGYTLITTTAPNVKTYTDTGLTAGTTYYYRIRSVNATGNSFYTSEVNVQVARSDYRRFLLDFGDPAIQTTATGWNNITSVVAGSIIPLNDSNGNATSLNLEVIIEPSANYAGGVDWISAGYNGQMADYPISAVNDSHLAWSEGGSYKLTGLNNSKVYDLRIFSSRGAPSIDREGLYTINGQQKTLNGANNSSQTVLFSNITPVDASIVINFNVAPGSTFAYINVLDIIESTNLSPPPANVSKLVLTPSMVRAVSPVGEGNPALLVDEQGLAGDPASGNGGQPTTSWGTNLAPKIMTAQLDLGAEYAIKQVWLFDTSGEATLPDGYKVIANTSAGDVTLVNSGMYGWMQWQSFNVDVTTRMLTIITPSGYLGMNELVLYGYFVSASNLAPIADAGPDKLIGLVANSTSITGNGSDSDGTITSYLWSQVSGPNTASLSGNTTATVTLSSLVVGTYIFRLTVTDDAGAAGSDDVTVTVTNDGLVPDVLELEALKRIAEGSDGDRLTGQGWPSVYNWPAAVTAAQFGTWPGVTVVDEDIAELSFTGDYYGYLPDVELPQLKVLNVSHSLLYGINASMPNLEELRIDYNFFSDGIIFAGYPKLKFLSMISYSYDCIGCETYDPDRTNFDGRNYYPSPDMSALLELETYEGGFNNFLVFPTGLTTLTSLKYIYLPDNYLQSMPNEIVNFHQLEYLDVSRNYLTDLPPTLVDLPSLQGLYISYNRLDFGDLEQFFSGVNEFREPDLYIEYDNQGNLPPLDITASAGKYTLINNRGGGVHSHYQWQEYNAGNWDNIPDKTLQNLVFDNMNQSYAGKRYRCEITNDWITDITIYSSEFTLESVSDFPMLAPSSLAAVAGSSLSITLSWVDNSNEETGFEIERSTVSGSDFENVGLAPANAVSFSDPGLTDGTNYFYRIRAINAIGSSDYSEEASAAAAYNMDELITQDSLRVVMLPPQVKVTRQGLLPTATGAPGLYLNQFIQGDDKLVFPNCPAGSSYIVGFELRYDLGDKNTTIEWLSKLNITMLQGETVLWTSPFQISSKNQVFVSTAFYDQPISCSQGYHFIIDTKLNVGVVPESSIVLNQIMYDATPFQFNTGTTATFTCPAENATLGFDPSTGESRVAWEYNPSATEFDLEWVFLADHEIDAIADFNNSASQAFQNKEGVRITTADRYYTHLIYYQKGKVWYRVRAVSYNPANPEHRITGAWFYSNCPYLEIDNPQPDKNWQVQTVFAEDGKYKKVVHYFDGTLRTRQSQTNLSTEGITMTGETLYDFEGRKSVEILAASAANNTSTLTFKPGINNFQSLDPLVASNTSATRVKFNYDNQEAENSILSTADGAGRYYSPANAQASVHEMLIPNGEGYVYSQTEYLNDGTGRIKRQSGVGEEFRMDGDHATQYYYGSASKAELVRLFGSNVGNASHYKKNLVVDGNGQMSVSYHDQSDRVIASALAGINPVAVDPLSSLSALQNNPDITIDITDKNERYAGVSITTHKILNTVPNTYTFNYDLTAVNPSELDCAMCNLDFTISITDPDGELLDLDTIPNNESLDTHYFSIYNFSGVQCDPSTINVQFPVPFLKIGDYTITKKLVAKELTYEELKTVVVETPAAQQKIQELIIAYNQIDYEKCAVCSTQPELCTDAENTIIEAFNNVAALDCENILQLIKKDLIAANSSNPEYVPQQAAIEADGRYCQYLLCIKDKESDVFDKQLARIASWSDPTRIIDPFTIDPFFNNPNLSGSAFKNSMIDKIADYPVTQINGIIFSGSIESITEPTNAAFFIDDFGNKTNSNAVGRHILYMDLMERKSQMTPTAYLDELDQQHWALFKSFYLEAKRLTKIEAYAGCASMISELQKVSTIPTTEQGVANWGVPEGITDPVSEYQLDVTMASIHLACNPSGPFFDPDTTPMLNLSPEHNTDIRNYLRAYFDGHPSNVFRVIIITDLSTDSNLIAIGNILGTYGCGLASLAQDDPFPCVNERRITYSIPPSSTNMIVNPYFQNSNVSSCFGQTNIMNSTCYPGWEAASGTPNTGSTGQVLFLWGAACNDSSEAIIGSLLTPLTPGRTYKLRISYEAHYFPNPPPDNPGAYYPGTVYKAYCQFTRNKAFLKADGSELQGTFTNLNSSFSNSANVINFSDSLNIGYRLSSNGAFSLESTCPDPSAKFPDLVRVGGNLTDKVWRVDNISNLTWNTDEINFVATEASTNFVFSIVSNSEVANGIRIKDISIIDQGVNYDFTYCTEYAPPIPHDYLSEFTIKCSENLVNESLVLRELAIDKYLEEEITTYSNTLRANCLDGATENLQYSYSSKEYHYTLYYYDQAGNLVQTVPPEGVVPLTAAQLNNFDNTPVDPPHKLITRYQYNSLNQLLAQTTPDAGESNFWYNDKSQLKLSQNAQQLLDNKYSYTKYDEQGRITEVGEMAATDTVTQLIAQFDDPEFPREQNMQTPAAGTYVLTDVTRTHYDYDFENPELINFTQQQLRNRVSWVEVTDQESQTPLVLEATSVYKNEGVLNGVSPQGVLASEVTQSGQTYLRVQNNCSGGCSHAGIAFFTPMPVTLGETYLFKAKGYSTSSVPVHFDIKGNGTQNLATFSTGGAALPVSAGAEGWITQTIVVPPGVSFLTINLAWDSPALNEVFFVNEFEIVKQKIDYYSSRTATYYSYDIHGNVKSLLQKVPGLTPKRTDYAYDLVSGKVNYVLYQYDEPDQFIHRYSYDADNRLTVVQTSTDGFLWDKDAEYSYYLHGPLARMELGDHRVQGLDYYYTLQGWLKGVNSPTGAAAQTNDPGHDGVVLAMNNNTVVGKDVFAYNLGYFNGDYKSIGGATTQAALIEEGSSALWTGVGGEALGLYNGNISWMATDLAKIGLESNNRNAGVQAMQYRYDQLHRLVQSRSHSFAGSSTPSLLERGPGGEVYDEDYTYDANGNLLTLKRNDELAALKDDFIYTYYSGTNRLKGVADPAESVTYTGAVTSNSTVYKNITLTGNAYIPTGEDVTLRATENIFIENQFNKAGGNSFRAYITEEGQYQYDAIGNLIVDTSEGTKISWTPYGKVRQVKAKGDSVVIDYRYDASGNRIEKRVASLGDAGWVVANTNYVRDASGNVMAIYSSPLGGGQEGALEQPIYGSSRLGLYKGGRKEGQQWLGRKNFELSNHLGNVLTVITDNITMSPTEGVNATIVSATDYYPFGLEMQGRTYSDTTYRYGFNGKEKDVAFASTNNYDYGFRIYNPRIAKFLSVDPLTDSYPWYTPYQFAGNNPIKFIDINGSEPYDPVPESYINTKLQIDMKLAPAGSKTNAAGFARNSQWFWRQMLAKSPELFSPDNVDAIRRGRAPIVNEQWVKYNPTHKSFSGQTLIHHHLEQADMATPLPKSVHEKWSKVFHESNPGGRTIGNLGRLNSFAGGLLLFKDIFSNDPHALGMQFSRGSKENTLYFDEQSETYFEITSAKIIKDEKDNIVSKTVTFDYYSDYKYNRKEGKYEGVNKLGTKTETYDVKSGKTTTGTEEKI